MFSPTLGRWTQNDPIEYDPGDPNLYQFVGNSPQVGLDPTGLADIKDAEAFKAILKEIGAGTDTGKAFEVITRLSLATQGGLKANTGLGANEAYVASTANPALVIPASLAGKRDAILRGASGNATPDLVGDFTLGKVGAAKMVLVDAKALDKNITLAGNTRSPYQSVKYIANLVQNATLFGTQGGAAPSWDKTTAWPASCCTLPTRIPRSAPKSWRSERLTASSCTKRSWTGIRPSASSTSRSRTCSHRTRGRTFERRR